MNRPEAEIRSVLVDLTNRAREQLVVLGATGSREAGRVAGDALDTLAAIVETVAAPAESQERLATIRFQAERLRRTDGAWFGQAGWIREALLATLESLEQLRECRDDLDIWTRAARQSTMKIEKGGALSFERAAIQDTFRATVDAFAVVAHFESVCRFGVEQT